ncbi:hypothetical protein JG688_00018555 [Phytophthora aleatoria]|uniref:Uncharacterized protein n=1 Tax=Phytophthora aleatoria TaxID=2496075 RepID=A0A8J5IR51_9STRA|nr:hypothetical protein JG688_00018555 [Phytophthora aleatoria]
MLRRDYSKDIGLLHVPLVGCAGHRLNLATEELLEESSQDLGSVQVLMIKLRSLNQAAKLRLKTSLRPVIRQETRWSSTFMILDRYFKLLELVKDDADLEDALPTRAENPRLKALHAELTNVESVTKALQSTKVSMADARLCQLAVREAPATGAASDGAQAAAKRRKTTGSSGDEEEYFVERLKSARKARLFSVARLTLGLEHHNLLPITFEAILFLRLNDGYWDVCTVDACC